MISVLSVAHGDNGETKPAATPSGAKVSSCCESAQEKDAPVKEPAARLIKESKRGATARANVAMNIRPDIC